MGEVKSLDRIKFVCEKVLEIYPGSDVYSLVRDIACHVEQLVVGSGFSSHRDHLRRHDQAIGRNSADIQRIGNGVKDLPSHAYEPVNEEYGTFDSLLATIEKQCRNGRGEIAIDPLYWFQQEFNKRKDG